jgi:phosphatidylglycerophosphatase A
MRLKNFFIKLFATGLGVGLSPVAAGTLGTIVALPVFWFLQMKGPITYMLMTLLFIIFACAIAELAGPLFNEVDSPHIVIDEIVGFLVTMTWLPRTWQSVALGFILFRTLDIWKPGPIAFVERKIRGGLGVVADDVAAGIIANMLMQVIYSNSNWLGAKLPL